MYCKCVHWQIVKTQIKCRMIRLYTVVKTKTISIEIFGFYSMWFLHTYNGTSQVYCFKPEGRIRYINIAISDQRDWLSGPNVHLGLHFYFFMQYGCFLLHLIWGKSVILSIDNPLYNYYFTICLLSLMTASKCILWQIVKTEMKCLIM